jgi:3',5'-cyclic AMP phosphodiesterase CpdA
MRLPLAVLALVNALSSQLPAQADSLAPRPFTFAVIGHVRGKNDGKLNPKMGELLERVGRIKPDFVVLTGDIVWGDIQSDIADTAEVRREWDDIDSAFATLGVPVFRVPGNHDISDLGTRDVFRQRYGPMPAVVERYGSRFILLSSAWIPADGDTRHQRIVRPTALDPAQVAFLKTELSRQGTWDQTFVVMHHMLYWSDSASWWRDVHPLLAAAGVSAVFAGDYGPLKFSHLTRDSVHYLQASMEGIMTLETLRNFERSRVLSSQFDNFLVVRVRGPEMSTEVETLGEFSSPQFQPAFYDSMMPRPKPTGWRRMVAELATPRKLLVLGLFGLMALGVGVLLGKRLGR